MNARDLLRQYLEQRRELGEREFVLDSLDVDDAMRALGANAPTAPAARRSSDTTPAAPTGDWRDALRAAGAAPTSEAREQPVIPRPPTPDPRPADPGLTIGSAATELFGGPLSQVESLDEIARRIAACTACGLHATAKRAVPGEGSPTAKFVCVGEAPGATEDEQGRPFVGQAGKLLTQILGAINLPREEVFICNVLKHRPPDNRNPAPDEIVACKPFLLRQLELLQPRVILALGTFAAQTLLDTKLAIGKLRGQVHRFHGVPLVVTYHPAALLRNPAWKRPTWEDVQLARRVLDGTAGGA